MTEEEKQQMKQRILQNYEDAKKAVPETTFTIAGTNTTCLDCRVEMNEVEEAYLEAWNRFMHDTAAEEALKKYVTQPFWHNIKATSKRQQSMGVRVEEVYCPTKSLFKDWEVMQVNPKKQFISGRVIRDIQTTRVVYLKGQPIYREKIREICYRFLLKSKVENGLIACPNCGTFAPTESYLDGCDFCKSKFTVQDFDAKVSGIYSMKKKLLKEQRFAEDYYILSKVIHDFTSEDFVQNIAYKITEIHMSDDCKSVSFMADCSIAEAVEANKNVIFCELENLAYIAASEDQDNYYATVEVELALLELQGKKVKKTKEKLAISLRGNKETIDRGVVRLREYKCNCCGNSIDLYESTTCPFCQNDFAYEKHDWVITQYDMILRR